MDSKVEACAECTRSCLSLHRAKRDPYPIVSSFFKVMFGKQFGEELIVPPRFAKTLKSLEGKSTYLEDSTGQKWDVCLTKVEGSLIFQRGWQEFSRDHGIELGDFVVFHYIKGSHFNVQTFTRTGCERPTLFCDKNYQNRRRIATRSFVAKGGSDGTPNAEILAKVGSNSRKVGGLDFESVRRQDKVRKSVDVSEDCPNEGSTHKRPKVAPAKDSVAEPFLMTSKSTSSPRDDDRDYLFDLSAFEMPAKKERTDDTSVSEVNRCLHGSNQPPNAQTGTASVDVEELPISETSPIAETCLPKEEPDLLPKNSPDIVNLSDSDMAERVATPVTTEFPAAAANIQSPGATARMVDEEQKPCENNGDFWVASSFRYIATDQENISNLDDSPDNSADLGNLNDKAATDDGFLLKTLDPEPLDFCDSMKRSS